MPDEQSNQNPQVPNIPSGTDGQQAPPATPQVSVNPVQAPDIQKLIQASEDRMRTHYSKELKARDQLIEDLKTKTMSESEIRKHREAQLGEREAELQRKEIKLLAIDVLRENDLPINLREFVEGKDPEETRARGASLKTEFQKAVELAVDGRFKENGRTPAKAGDLPLQGKKTYTQSEVDAEMKRVTRPETPQKERETIMTEIHAAMREGRIKK